MQLANSLNAFIAGDYQVVHPKWVMPISDRINVVGSPTIAYSPDAAPHWPHDSNGMEGRPSGRYLIRESAEKNPLTLPDGANFDNPQLGANTTIVARASRTVKIQKDVAELKVVNGPNFPDIDTKIFLEVTNTESLRRVYGVIFDGSVRDMISYRYGEYEIALARELADKWPSGRSVTSSSALQTPMQEVGEITALNEITVTSIDFGLPTSSVERFRIINKFYPLEGLNERGEIIYAGYYEFEENEDLYIAGYATEDSFATNLVKVDGRLVWALQPGETLADSIANNTTTVFGVKRVINTDKSGRLVTLYNGTLQPTIVPARHDNKCHGKRRCKKC